MIVWSSTDYNDAPTFEPVVGTAAMPDRRPVLALQEAVTRYLPKYLPVFLKPGGAAPEGTSPEPPASQKDIDWCTRSEGELIRMAQQTGAGVIVAQHLQRDEQDGRFLPGHDVIEATARDSGATVVQLGPVFRQAIDAGRNPYRDFIHPNDAGQKIMAETLLPTIEAALKGRPVVKPAAAPAEHR